MDFKYSPTSGADCVQTSAEAQRSSRPTSHSPIKQIPPLRGLDERVEGVTHRQALVGSSIAEGLFRV